MTCFETTVMVGAFNEEHVERLTGLSVHQLRYWDRTGFFIPSFANDNRKAAMSRVYSFKDVAALRVLSVLRKQYSVSLQHLRQVSHELSHLDDDKWTRTTLYVLNRKVLFVDSDVGVPREVVSGQYVLGIPLRAVLSDTKKDVERLRVRAESKVGIIERNRRVARNAAVVGGTRIPVSAILNFHNAGYTVAQILREYPDLVFEDIDAAIAYGERTAAA